MPIRNYFKACKENRETLQTILHGSNTFCIKGK